jgi:hypothetical protein
MSRMPKIIIFTIITIDAASNSGVYFLRSSGWSSAYFRRDEFTFTAFKVENRVRNAVRTRTKRPICPAAGHVINRGPRLAGKERVPLSLASPVFISLKTLGISERLSRKPPYVCPEHSSGSGRVRLRRTDPARGRASAQGL